MLILRIQECFFLTYRTLKVAGNYRPERRKMGFDLRTFGAMLGGIYHKKCCLQSLLLLLASIGYVINSRLPLMRPSSLASIAFVMTGVLARLSISLMRKINEVRELTWHDLAEIMSEEKANQKEKVTLFMDDIKKYYPRSATPKDIAADIMKMLESRYKARRNRDAR